MLYTARQQHRGELGATMTPRIPIPRSVLCVYCGLARLVGRHNGFGGHVFIARGLLLGASH